MNSKSLLTLLLAYNDLFKWFVLFSSWVLYTVVPRYNCDISETWTRNFWMVGNHSTHVPHQIFKWTILPQNTFSIT